MKYIAEIFTKLKRKPTNLLFSAVQASRYALFGAVYLCVSSGAQASGTTNPTPKLVTSVHPVQMIVSAISHGISTPTVLVPPGATPHEYSLKPSNVRNISQANALFWVGPSLETFLGKTLQRFANNPDLTVVALIESNELDLIDLKHGHHHTTDSASEQAIHEQHNDEHGNEESHENEHDEQHDEHVNHDDHGEQDTDHIQHLAQNWDPHIWLNPINALAMAKQVAKVLTNIDPDHAERYRDNLTKFEQSIGELDRQLAQLLTPLTGQGYFVFHDGYSYFERRYGLSRLGEFSVNESKPSVKKMISIQTIIKQGDAVCVFSEPQFNRALIDAVTRGTKVGVAVLDPLGDIYHYSDAAPHHYFEFMRQFSQQFAACLAD